MSTSMENINVQIGSAAFAFSPCNEIMRLSHAVGIIKKNLTTCNGGLLIVLAWHWEHLYLLYRTEVGQPILSFAH